MSDLAEIAEGRRPWEPSPGTVPGEILHRYNMPLVGVIEQHGVRYLFQCWAGEVARANMWLYTSLDEDQERLFGDEDGPFSEALEQATSGEGVLAVALDGRIVAWETVPNAARPLAEIVDLLSDRALAVLQEESRAVEALRATV